MVKYKTFPRTREGVREAIHEFLKDHYNDPRVKIDRLDAGTLRITVRQVGQLPQSFRVRIVDE